jgi:ubiquitin-like modifier-activating enzyme ATG7
MCTVTRPGIAPIAAASAVELLVSLVQHPAGVNAPAETPSAADPAPTSISPMGLVPHQIRGQLALWKNVLVEAPAFEQCTGCSSAVVNEYRKEGFAMLLRAFNEPKYLEEVTGLDRLQRESEEMMQGGDWDGSGDEEF